LCVKKKINTNISRKSLAPVQELNHVQHLVLRQPDQSHPVCLKILSKLLFTLATFNSLNLISGAELHN